MVYNKEYRLLHKEQINANQREWYRNSSRQRVSAARNRIQVMMPVDELLLHMGYKLR